MRLIDADALDKMLMDAQAVSKEKGGNFRCGVIGSVRENIRMMPTVEPERKRGHWIDIDSQLYTWKVRCDQCGHERSMMSTQGKYPRFCEDCGAEMMIGR